MNVLVVAAHPDDEVLGCGATIARGIAAGHNVCVLLLGEGVAARAGNRDASLAIANLKVEAKNANAALGVIDLRFEGLPDNRFDSVDLLDVVQIIERVIDDVVPDVVLTHHESDVNIDHQVTNRAVITATRPLPGHAVSEVLCFETLSSSEWSFGRFDSSFAPNVFVEVTGYLEAKCAALAAYESEIRSFPHPRSIEAIQASGQRWGSVVGCFAAEPFVLVRNVRRTSAHSLMFP